MRAIGRPISFNLNPKNSSSLPQIGRFVVNAGNMDLGSYLQLGGGILSSDIRSFSHVRLSSANDMRWVDTRNQSFRDGESAKQAALWSDANLTLSAQRIYPATGVSAQISVIKNSEQPERSLVIEQVEGPLQHQKPYSVLGSLVLEAPVVDQGGTLYAPWGALRFKGDQLRLRSGSLTSVSTAGLQVPFGGTADGESWFYAGEEFKGAAWFNKGGVHMGSPLVEVERDAVVDLSGGGELVGAGFLAGRGGSSDARFVPLIQVGQDGFYLPG